MNRNTKPEGAESRNHKRTMRPLAVALSLMCSACVSVPEVVGGEPFSLPAEARGAIGVRYVTARATRGVTDRYAEATDPNYREGFVDPTRQTSLEGDLGQEIGEELQYCATGSRRVDVTVLVDSLVYDGRLRSLADGNGIDEMSAIVEFVEPDAPGAPVLARYRVTVGARSGNVLERVLGDRVSHAAEELGRALCMQAFGRNPRPPAIQNMTR